MTNTRIQRQISLCHAVLRSTLCTVLTWTGLSWGAVSVTRSLSTEDVAPGGTFQVDLSVVITGNAPLGLIVQQRVPDGWVVTNATWEPDGGGPGDVPPSAPVPSGNRSWLFDPLGVPPAEGTLSVSVTVPGAAESQAVALGGLALWIENQQERGQTVDGDGSIAVKAVVAGDDVYETGNGMALVTAAPGVLGNDATLQGSALDATLVDDVEHGTLELGGDGAFVYTPEQNFVGQDSFTYLADNGEGASALGTVSILVYDGWRVTIDAVDGQFHDSVQFGITADATETFDEAVDVLAAADARMVLAGPEEIDGDLMRDMRGTAEGAKWLVIVTASDSAVSLVWDRSSMPHDGLQIQQLSLAEGAPVPDTSIDMAAVEGLSVEASTTALFRVTLPPVSVELSFSAGWDLLALPSEPVDPRLEVVMSGIEYAGSVWAWDTTSGDYHAVTVFEPLAGWWGYTDTPQTQTVLGLTLASTEIALATGWNLIGVAEEAVLQSVSGVVDPGWYWQEKSYHPARLGDALTPGLGYWFYALQPTVLTLEK